MRVAFIEESEAHVKKLCAEASTLGHQVSFVANSSAEALKALSVHDVDVIISDQIMPGSDGTELMRKIQSAHQHVRVVAIEGGYLERSMLPTSRLTGAAAVLPRPYQLSQLDEAIAGRD